MLTQPIAIRVRVLVVSSSFSILRICFKKVVRKAFSFNIIRTVYKVFSVCF